MSLLEKIIPWLNEARTIRSMGLDENDLALIKSFCFITAKRSMYVANVKEDGFENNEYLAAVQQYAQAENAPVVAVCAAVEAEIAELDDEDKTEFLADMGMTEPGLNRVIRAAYGLLRSEEHTSELQSLMRISYAVFCLKKKKNQLDKYAI